MFPHQWSLVNKEPVEAVVGTKAINQTCLIKEVICHSLANNMALVNSNKSRHHHCLVDKRHRPSPLGELVVAAPGDLITAWENNCRREETDCKIMSVPVHTSRSMVPTANLR